MLNDVLNLACVLFAGLLSLSLVLYVLTNHQNHRDYAHPGDLYIDKKLRAAWGWILGATKMTGSLLISCTKKANLFLKNIFDVWCDIGSEGKRHLQSSIVSNVQHSLKSKADSDQIGTKNTSNSEKLVEGSESAGKRAIPNVHRDALGQSVIDLSLYRNSNLRQNGKQ